MSVFVFRRKFSFAVAGAGLVVFDLFSSGLSEHAINLLLLRLNICRPYLYSLFFRKFSQHRVFHH